MEFLLDYGLFLAKSATIVIAVMAVLTLVISLAAQGRKREKETLEIKHLNQKYQDMADAIRSVTLSDKGLKKLHKNREKEHKQKQKSEERGQRLYVLDFHGDINASAVTSFREEISALLTAAEENDEVLVRLESGGGLVHAYGLASSQMVRIKNKGLKLTVAVDKVAASGGYMMACVADHLVAAPFAIVGSIGVLAQVPNFNRLLKRHEIDFEQITAGEHKRTLSLFGENTEAGRQKAREEIEDTHALFKEFVIEQRPGIDLASVATGEHWYGLRALELKLVDELKTSDDFILEAAKTREVYSLHFEVKKNLMQKLFPQATVRLQLMHRGLNKLLNII